jgi:hypothetical protein
MRAPPECESQTEPLYADDMLISTVHSTWKDSGPMVSAMRELFVSPMKRVRKEMTFTHIQIGNETVGHLFLFFFLSSRFYFLSICW